MRSAFRKQKVQMIEVEGQRLCKERVGSLLPSGGREKGSRSVHIGSFIRVNSPLRPFDEGEEKNVPLAFKEEKLLQVRLRKDLLVCHRGSITRMEQPPVQWPSEVDDSTIIFPSELSSLDHFDAQEIIGSLGEGFEYPPYLVNHSSFSAFDSPGNTEFMEASERPINVIKAEGVPGAVSNASSINSFISFANLESLHDPLQLWPRNETEALHCHGSTSNEKTLDFQRPEKSSMASRPTSQDHVIAERKRREKLSQQFIALSAIIPDLKKTDKASLVGGAINYVKQLEEKVKTLEEQAVKKSTEPTVVIKKSHLSINNDISDTNGSSPGKVVQNIEASLEGKTILIRIHCEQKKGVLVRLLSEIEKLHLSVINTGVVPFTDSSLNITVTTQIEEGFSITVKDVVKELNSALSQLL